MNIYEIQDDTRFLLGGADEYADADITRNANLYYHHAQQLAISASKIWRVNKGYIETDIVDGIKDYPLVLASPLLTLDHIEINLSGSNDSYQTMNIVGDRDMITEGNTDNLSMQDTDDRLTCRLHGNTVSLNFEPTSTVVDGIRVYYVEKWSDLRANTIELEVEEAEGKTLLIEEISSETDATLEAINVIMTQNTIDTLAVTWTSGTSTINIALANTTASKNTAALIQAGIRLLTSTGIDFTDATCTGTNWTNITGATITDGTDTATLVAHDTPELDDLLHRYLSYGAAYDYTIAHDLDDKTKKILNEVVYYRDRIINYYANRVDKGRTRIIPIKSRFN